MVPRSLVRPDVAATPPTTDAYGLVVRLAGLAPFAVGSTAFRITNSTAQRIPVVLSSTTSIIVGEVEIKNDSGNPVPVTASALDITLSALRTAITAGATLDSIVTGLSAVYGRLGDGSNVVDTELSAPAALADTVSNPTVTSVGSFLSGWDGSNWNRVRVQASNADAQAVTATPGLLQMLARLTGYNGTTFDRIRTGSPSGEPGNVGVLAMQLHVADGTNINRVLSPGGDGLGAASKLPAALLGYNGATWDRLRSSTANGLQVDVRRVQGIVAVTSTSVKLAAGAATVGKVDQGAAGAASWLMTSTSVKLAAGAATIGKADQGAAGAAAWPVKSTGVTVTNTTHSLSAATLAALENISVQNTTAASVPTAEQNCLVPKKYGCILLTYSTFVGSTSRKLTSAVYKAGSSTTATVATLTLAYSTLLQLASVART